MGLSYQAVGWNRQKAIYDGTAGTLVVAYLICFVATGFVVRPEATLETLLIRALGSCAFLMLHVVLCIGPLCRLDRRWLPLLYNRRHLGVMTFTVAALHGLFSLFQFHALGDVDPLTSLFTSNRRFGSLAHFPFELLGVASLVVLFLMAATSHDFWLRNLTAPVWKLLHMSVYLAWALLVLHVALGVLQAETHPLWTVAVAAGVAIVLGLHLLAAVREMPRDVEYEPQAVDREAWMKLCEAESIPDGRARIFSVGNERVAVFRYGERISALSNLCQHQNGPLGEGCVRNGLVVCPWHGYEYDPASGASPAPFHERVPTFRTEVRDGMVWLDPVPLAAGTHTEPARLPRVRYQ